MGRDDVTHGIRLATATDVGAILELEHSSPAAAHWKQADYERAITQPERLVLVAERQSKLVGFLVASTATAEWELENIAVSAMAKRQGIGRTLLLALIDSARKAKATEIRQEIRASNTAAQKLGLSLGFLDEGRRPNYYQNPTEDALLFKYLPSKG
ncbi:MAG: ribosomal-protein-alanine N-acetyltransferase [Acidobacteria bacterium 13_1_20CM_4_56_7]|jgi:ribosomal-protein-alanine acetyltransferase|nr:MAG: ribosomal-protein-alanine N-acetyltransferase [Acidobacteria bacterium 13_1_20CM_4_56_7]